ncbi:Cmi7p SCDLUD_005160 [Saccharomycodes ludwigii]|uniref:Cmi7p n=1 Tax=Saccharomycodes ludwigii TaxID=36035 RepID=UPI001E881422|nr:hypothetical protein SCDLUD_005160 [Saccharomycodes ludwigii]KAH3898822.1 hypothetical protein SCDLUD_005160 [Saccharomycodes ludwigii]
MKKDTDPLEYEVSDFNPLMLADMLKNLNEGEEKATEMEKMLDKLELRIQGMVEELGLDKDASETSKNEEKILPGKK